MPGELKTENMCLEAVKQDGELLEFVPETLRTLELCFETMKNVVEGGLEELPEGLREEVRSMLAASLADREHGAC